MTRPRWRNGDLFSALHSRRWVGVNEHPSSVCSILWIGNVAFSCPISGNSAGFVSHRVRHPLLWGPQQKCLRRRIEAARKSFFDAQCMCRSAPASVCVRDCFDRGDPFSDLLSRRLSREPSTSGFLAAKTRLSRAHAVAAATLRVLPRRSPPPCGVVVVNADVELCRARSFTLLSELFKFLPFAVFAAAKTNTDVERNGASLPR